MSFGQSNIQQAPYNLFLPTLNYLINEQDGISEQGEIFYEKQLR